MKDEGVASASVDLYWLPLGAGGWFVAFNGRVYETIVARREQRTPLQLFHTALVVTVPTGRFVVENAWPIPDHKGSVRGVVVEGPVWSPVLGRARAFRYELRRWRDGTIADITTAVGGHQRVSERPEVARRILELAPDVPPLLWGRKPPGAGEMWNSNSAISWLLTTSGADIDEIEPPTGGRAPGWSTGIDLARAPNFPTER